MVLQGPAACLVLMDQPSNSPSISQDHAVNVSARLHSLVVSAAHSAGTAGAVLVLRKEGGFALTVQHGPPGMNFRITDAACTELLSEEYGDGLDGGARSTEKLRTLFPELQFFVSLPVRSEGESAGFLAVCDTEAKVLNAAQQYVLRTLASEVGDQLQLASLRKAHEEHRTLHSTTNERLRLLESVVVNANDAVLITEAEPVDLPGPRILYANAAFTRVTGYSLEEVLGKTPRILQGPDTNAEPLKRLKAALKAWKPVEVELQNYRKDGSTFWVELSIVPVADETGWYTHWVSVQRDVSERKQNEEDAVRFRLAQVHNAALAKEVEERMRSEAELAHTAFHDHLTGLRNRAYFLDRLKTSVEQASTRPHYQCAVLFLDLDDFKGVNDRFGHSVGDLLLQKVAQRLNSCTRPQDTLARIGGDEFTLLLDNVEGLSEVLAVAERVLQALAVPIQLAGNEIVASASIGLSLGTYTDPEHLLRAADTAMYRAKEDGGSRYAIFNEQMHESAMAALKLRVEMREALEKNQFELHYQPLVDTVTNRICGLEALVRWRHPERGLVPPLDFIPVAEETGLIIPLGSWVLREACRHLRAWQRTLPLGDHFKVNVNVSTRQLEDADFFDQLQSVLEETGVRASDLQLEITESVFLKSPVRIGALFSRIRALGVSIACDDFGTGYSSLSYLQLYPIDTIKIDQSFVRRLHSGQADADIIRMIIGLARALRMDVSAEGVEEPRQQSLLRDLGCTVVQGYLYSRPLPFETTTQLLYHGISGLTLQDAVSASSMGEELAARA